eukprot:4474710-Amphidinium_carterae.1
MSFLNARSPRREAERQDGPYQQLALQGLFMRNCAPKATNQLTWSQAWAQPDQLMRVVVGLSSGPA